MCSMSRELERVSLSGDSFRCAICLDTARDAVESDCCHQLYCAACISGVLQCPTCRRWHLTVRPNMILRRLINEIPTACEYCHQLVARSDLHTHKASCEQQPIACAAPTCAFVGPRDALLRHLANTHREHLLKNYTRLFTETPLPRVVPQEEVVWNYFKERGQPLILIMLMLAVLIFAIGFGIGRKLCST